MPESIPLLDLGSEFYVPVEGGVFSDPQLRYRNQNLALELGLHSLTDSQWVDHFGRFHPISNNLKSPLAMKYHGHQFQHYNPDIGDGRGFVFAQFVLDSKLFELGTKGSGTTPFSRRGDGRLTLKGAVRELLATSYLEKQRVLTSRTFSIVETGEKLYRGDEPSPTRSAVLFRLSRGHIRIGNFQYFHFHKDKKNILKLVDYSLTNFYGQNDLSLSSKEKIELFFENATLRLADLCASYMVAGFVHGVLNTDNMNVSGESFDYGPYRFLPHYDPYFTAAYFDHEGLYCFGRQPPSFVWNLEQLRQALLFAEPSGDLSNLESKFATYFNVFFTARFLRKLNLKPLVSSSEQSSLKLFLDLAPNYYEPCKLPILEIKRSDIPQIEGIAESGFFQTSQVLVDHFFKDLLDDKFKFFEMAFFEILNFTHFDQVTEYFSVETRKLILEKFERIQILSQEQIQSRKQTLIIDEIERLWQKIDLENRWDEAQGL